MSEKALEDVSLEFAADAQFFCVKLEFTDEFGRPDQTEIMEGWSISKEDFEWSARLFAEEEGWKVHSVTFIDATPEPTL